MKLIAQENDFFQDENKLRKKRRFSRTIIRKLKKYGKIWDDDWFYKAARFRNVNIT